MWREDGALWMAGRTRSYAVDPRGGEYVVGMITSGAMRARRGRRQWDFGPGDVCVWDPSAPHHGHGDWTAWLAVLEEPGPLQGLEFPDPVSATKPAGTVTEWLHDLAGPRAQLTRDDPASYNASVIADTEGVNWAPFTDVKTLPVWIPARSAGLPGLTPTIRSP